MELDSFSSPAYLRTRTTNDARSGGRCGDFDHPQVRAFQADCRQIEMETARREQSLTVAEVLPRLRTRNHE
jgi:hypothetical protein